jgi:Polyketide cyclase / dehydrase and lipid transport
MKKHPFSLMSRLSFFSLAVLLANNLNAAELMPYRGEPPRIALTDAERVRLEKFEPVYPSITDDGNAGGGQAMFRVKADPETIWGVIADFPNYPTFNKDLQKADYYKPRQGNFFYVRFAATKFFYTVNWHVKHNYPMMKKGWGTWELDKKQANDLSECIGFWRVDQVPGTNYTDVSYSVNLASDGVILNLFKGMLIKEGVQKATQWVKNEAEKRARN